MFHEIKSKYIFKRLFKYIHERIYLKLLKYNKKLQNKLGLTLDNYKYFGQIEIEIIPINKLYEFGNNIFINRLENKSFYHIYFDDQKYEIDRNNICQTEKIKKIKVVIDSKITSLKDLFYDCVCIKEIKFLKCNRMNISDMSGIFNNCENLVKLDISKLSTNDTTNMFNMFGRCKKLKEINLSNFKTDNVENMSQMFDSCTSLEKLDLSNFNTRKVKNMNYMFNQCSSLEELNIGNFITDNVENMIYMFRGCNSLKIFDISNFNIKEFTNGKIKRRINGMFYGCPDYLKEMVKMQRPDFDEKIFKK